MRSRDLLAANSRTGVSEQAVTTDAGTPSARPSSSSEEGLDFFLLWSLKFFDAQSPHDRGVWYLASRAVVEVGGVPRCFWRGPSAFGNAACRYAHRRYLASQTHRLFQLLTYEDLCALERAGEMSQLPSVLASYEHELLTRCYGEPELRRRTALALKRAINGAAWRLALGVAWRRYGPTALIVLGTCVAFGVAMFVWLQEAGLNLGLLMQEWVRFVWTMWGHHSEL